MNRYRRSRNNARHSARSLGRGGIRLSVERLEPRTMLAGLMAVGTDAGVPAEVRIFTDRDNNGTYESRAPGTVTQDVDFRPFGGFGGGVRVALGDFDGDGNAELVTAAGPGGGPHVILWDLNSDGSIGGILDSFFAYGNFNGGVFVAAGDLDNDGRDELITAPDAGGGPHVKIFSDIDSDGLLSDNLVDQLFPFGTFTGGVRVAAGNTNNSGGDELIVAAGPGGGPQVVVFTDSDNDRAVSDHAALESFFAYSANFTGGVYVAAGPVEQAGGGGNVAAEIITGAGATGGPHVKIFTDNNANGTVSDNALFDQFFAYDPGFTGGVRVAAGDTENTGSLVEVVTGPGPTGGPHIKVFDDSGDGGFLLSDNALDDEFFAFDPGYNAGVFVAFGKVTTEAYALRGGAPAIPDLGPLNVSVFVPATAGVVRALDVTLSIQHTFAGDLDVTLTHVASGTSVLLFSDVGGADDGFMVRLSDTAPTDIGAGDSLTDGPITGLFNLEGAALLSAFHGIDASGEWRLTIADDNAGDTGRLFGWELHVGY